MEPVATPKMAERKRYLSFLLRIWLAGDNNPLQWRSSLENTHTGERLGFASLEDLFRYLKRQIQPQIGEKEANKEV